MTSSSEGEPIPPPRIAHVLAGLSAASGGTDALSAADRGHHGLPSRDACLELAGILRSIFFPGYFGFAGFSGEGTSFHLGSLLDDAARILREQVRRAFCFFGEPDRSDTSDCTMTAAVVCQEVLDALPEIKRLLALDVQAAFEGDPALTAAEEAIFCYPGIHALTNHRVAHELYRRRVPLLPRIISESAHSATGIDIHPGASIGERFFIDHGTGVVIGETSVIGARVRVYQGVTLGAKSFPLDAHGQPMKGIPRHPIVEDDVVIYGGATILGRITIGRGSTIGGNVWLTEGVPPGSRVTQAQVRQDRFHAGEGI